MLSRRLNFNKLGGWGAGSSREKRESCEVEDDWNEFTGMEGPREVTEPGVELEFRNEDKELSREDVRRIRERAREGRVKSRSCFSFWCPCRGLGLTMSVCMQESE